MKVILKSLYSKNRIKNICNVIEYFLYLFFGINFLNKKNLYLKISIKNKRRRLGEFIHQNKYKKILY